jgi:hypothetical protein
MIWKLFMFKKLLPLLFLFAGFQANATLIDNGDYSTDTQSGLDWLDWTLTTDMTQHDALLHFSRAGWRIATATEAVGLIENHFNVVVGATGHAGGSASVILPAKYIEFLSLFGDTSGGLFAVQSGSTIEGFGLVGSGGSLVFAGFEGLWDFSDIDQYSKYLGVALVKDAAVSEPAVIALFALGLVGIGFARRRQS